MNLKKIFLLVISVHSMNLVMAQSNDTTPTRRIVEPYVKKITHEVGVNLAPLIFSGGWGGNNFIYYYKLHLPSGKLSFRITGTGDFTNSKRDLNASNSFMNDLPSNVKYSSDILNSYTLQIGVQHRLRYYESNHPIEVFCFEGLILSQNTNHYQSMSALQTHYVSGEPKPHLDQFSITDNVFGSSTYGMFGGIGASFKVYPHIKLTLETSISGQRDKTESHVTINKYTENFNGFELDGEPKTTPISVNASMSFQIRPTTYLYLAYSF